MFHRGVPIELKWWESVFLYSKYCCSAVEQNLKPIMCAYYFLPKLVLKTNWHGVKVWPGPQVGNPGTWEAPPNWKNASKTPLTLKKGTTLKYYLFVFLRFAYYVSKLCKSFYVNFTYYVLIMCLFKNICGNYT